MKSPSAQLASRAEQRALIWFWPPRLLTLVVAGCVLSVALLANFPAIEVPHAGLTEGTYGLHFDIEKQYEHGWPLVYSRRWLLPLTAANDAISPWQPWDRPDEWSTFRLLVDLAVWSAAILAAGAAAQYWRSRRRAIWQLDLRDLLLLTGAACVVFAWVAASRWEHGREQALLAEFRERNGNPQMEHEVAASVPAWWPDSLQGRYREVFNRTCLYRSSGDTDLACQHRRVITLRETAFHREFPQHLRQMPGLEALDLSYTRLLYFDATRQATLLRDLSPLPNLRGINLYGTNVTDSDMAWLAACPRLEVIDLSDTAIGDHGLALLAKLPRLRVLRIDSRRVSDAGCRRIAEMTSLEELNLGSRNVHDAGVGELARLTNLRRLKLTSRASPATIAALRQQLPACVIRASSYPREQRTE